MKRKKEGWSVVLAGFWNRMIFTPEWVGPRLFEGNAEIETVVALLPILPIIYRDNQVAVEVSNSRIVCRARDLASDPAILRSGQVAQVILNSLPETPVQGVGINFAFREESPTTALLDLFDFADNPRWTEAGWELGERKLSRQFTLEDHTLNLAFTLIGATIDIDCNFHTDPENHDSAVAAVAGQRVIRQRDLALETLRDLYDLELENSNDDS